MARHGVRQRGTRSLHTVCQYNSLQRNPAGRDPQGGQISRPTSPGVTPPQHHTMSEARSLLLSVLGDEADDEVIDFVMGTVDDADTSIDEVVELLAAHAVTDVAEERRDDNGRVPIPLFYLGRASVPTHPWSRSDKS